MLYKSDPDEKNQQPFSILDGLNLLCLPGAVYELRIPKTSQGTISGFFTDRKEMALGRNGIPAWCTASIFNGSRQG